MLLAPSTVRAELVEGLPFSSTAKGIQAFDQLRPDGFGA